MSQRVPIAKRVQRIALTGLVCLMGALAVASGALAQDRVQVSATQYDGYARLILDFVDRLDMPEFDVSSENNVLAIVFDAPVSTVLPDIAGALPNFVTVVRNDPDFTAIRLGLLTDFEVNVQQAGEQLYIDLLGKDWQGLPPGLPPEVVAELAERAKDAAALAEQQRIIEIARAQQPKATVTVGTNPSFVRIGIEWSQDTEAEFEQVESDLKIRFSWPSAIDFFPLIENLPPEILNAQNGLEVDGNLVTISLAEGAEARFYEEDQRHFVIDVDRLNIESRAPTAEELLEAAIAEQEMIRAQLDQGQARENDNQEGPLPIEATQQMFLVPVVSENGQSTSVSFSFDVETPAALFKRGDMLWLVFDSTASIKQPRNLELLIPVAQDFSAISAGDAQIVRMRVPGDQLASLGSQGTGWILTLGDLMVAPAEPIELNRRTTNQGDEVIAVNMGDPARLHVVRDPDAGDLLNVVTMFPPARGHYRNVTYVDFDVLNSVHGLVVKPNNPSLTVDLTRHEAILSVPDGLTLSPLLVARSRGAGGMNGDRASYVNLIDMQISNARRLKEFLTDLELVAATEEGRAQEQARIDLANAYLANGLAYEAIGVLRVAIDLNQVEDLREQMILTKAAADVAANRPEEALETLSSELFVNQTDAIMWRTIARRELHDYDGAHTDALQSEGVIDVYPNWVQVEFLLSAIEAAIEVQDFEMTRRMVNRVSQLDMTHEERSRMTLLQGRQDEMELRFDEALDTYGQVIAQDVRPTRAEAIFRTLKLLHRIGRLDASKGADILLAETISWRGGLLEAEMLQLLADLQFAAGDYRGAFATVREAAAAKVDETKLAELTDRAQVVFADLYLNGAADELDPVEALTLFYTYRHLTPAGARGDEMIRNLARRLVNVDLLAQAADLLEYQVNNRLEGAARAQIAADLAIIHIANRAPDKALDALTRTGIANLAPSLERQRRILEARALIDAGRAQLALDVLRNLDGRDAEVLRVDAYWRDRQYQDAAEQIELIYSENGVPASLGQIGRQQILKGAVGFVLASDQIGLARYRAKFAPLMGETPEWPLFDYVTSLVTQYSSDFRALAAEVSGKDSLSAFLTTYRQTYEEDGALTPTEPAASLLG